MEKKMLIPREYQIPAIEFSMNNDLAILGITPGGGKTEMSIEVIKRYLELNPNSKVLVLSHSTNVLKKNYFERLESLILPFSYSINLNDDSQVHICLPHSNEKITKKYDFLIVDEAHENYLAKRVQGIIKKSKPSKQLLLTGSPSVFIKEKEYKDKIYTLALNELPVSFFATLSIELVAVKAYWKNKFNADMVLKKGRSMSKEETNDALNKIIDALIKRLKTKVSAEKFNTNSLRYKMLSSDIGLLFNKLEKTIFFTKSVKDSVEVYRILKSKGVSCNVSHSDSKYAGYDKESKVVSDFTGTKENDYKDSKYDVLVVVDRTRLGYSNDNLYNIVDMSGTHNPNMIYQILSRVVRGKQTQNKFYLKVTTTELGMMDYTNACTCAALMLTDHKYLSTFDGSNLKLVAPTIKNSRVIKKDKNKTKTKTKNKPTLVFPEFTNDVVQLFKDIINDLNNPASIYKATSLSEVRNNLFSDKQNYTDESAKEIAKQYNTKQELVDEYPGLAKYARERGIWEKITSHMEKSKYHNRYSVEDLNEMKSRIKSRTEFANTFPGPYGYICNNIGVDVFFADMPSKIVKITLESAREAIYKCKTHKELREKFASIVVWLRSNNLFETETKNLVKTKKHSNESVFEDARLAGNPTVFNSVKFQGAYAYAKRNNLLDEIYESIFGIKRRILSNAI